MKGPIQIKFGLSFFPTLQYSNTPVLQYSSTPKELASLPAKPSSSDFSLMTRFSMFIKPYFGTIFA